MAAQKLAPPDAEAVKAGRPSVGCRALPMQRQHLPPLLLLLAAGAAADESPSPEPEEQDWWERFWEWVRGIDDWVLDNRWAVIGGFVGVVLVLVCAGHMLSSCCCRKKYDPKGIQSEEAQLVPAHDQSGEESSASEGSSSGEESVASHKSSRAHSKLKPSTKPRASKHSGDASQTRGRRATARRDAGKAFLDSIDRSLGVAPRFTVGDAVEVFSRGLGVWLPGKVLKVHSYGDCLVSYRDGSGRRGQKAVPMDKENAIRHVTSATRDFHRYYSDDTAGAGAAQQGPAKAKAGTTWSCAICGKAGLHLDRGKCPVCGRTRAWADCHPVPGSKSLDRMDTRP